MSKRPTPLKRAIFESGVLQKDLADKIGIDKGHMSRIVNGLHPTDATRRKIARALNRSERDLWPERIDEAA